jgi:hypothetical protein
MEVPVPTEAAGANVTRCINGGCLNEVVPWPKDTPNGAALILGSLRGPGFSAPCETALDDVGSTPMSFDIMDLRAGELGLPGCPRVPLLPASWRQVAWGRVWS